MQNDRLSIHPLPHHSFCLWLPSVQNGDPLLRNGDAVKEGTVVISGTHIYSFLPFIPFGGKFSSRALNFHSFPFADSSLLRPLRPLWIRPIKWRSHQKWAHWKRKLRRKISAKETIKTKTTLNFYKDACAHNSFKSKKNSGSFKLSWRR